MLPVIAVIVIRTSRPACQLNHSPFLSTKPDWLAAIAYQTGNEMLRYPVDESFPFGGRPYLLKWNSRHVEAKIAFSGILNQ